MGLCFINTIFGSQQIAEHHAVFIGVAGFYCVFTCFIMRVMGRGGYLGKALPLRNQFPGIVANCLIGDFAGCIIQYLGHRNFLVVNLT